MIPPSFILPAVPLRPRCRQPAKHIQHLTSSTCFARSSLSLSLAPTVSVSTPFEFDAFQSLLEISQSAICDQFEQIDGGAKFTTDDWQYEKGHGCTRGKVYEKAGVNTSVVSGILSKERAKAMTSRGRNVKAGTKYKAASLSLVFHAQSPFLPTLRGDIRIFMTICPDTGITTTWGGGGADLTIFYIDRMTFHKFHRHWSDSIQHVEPGLYEQMKTTCDEYFYLPSRAEYRGIGGIFYDDLQFNDDGDKLLEFQAFILDTMIQNYRSNVLERNLNKKWTPQQKTWQKIRRGRYLEFNLLNDRGVKFGLAGAPPWRTDSIMISAPPSIEFPYAHSPAVGTPESDVLHLLQGKPVDWASLDVIESNK